VVLAIKFAGIIIINYLRKEGVKNFLMAREAEVALTQLPLLILL
jgi:hypothetical protein